MMHGSNKINLRWIMLGALGMSVVLSYFVGARETVINPDGICYLLSAQHFETGNLKEAMHLCPQAQWPLYSFLIFGLSKLSHFSYLNSAHIWNALFSMMTVGSFILIAHALGASKRILILAALAVLFDHQLNVLRDNVIRDHGFWACYLFSVYALLRYYRSPSLMWALLWNSAIIVATLFRIEGAVFLLAMPLTALLCVGTPMKQRVMHMLQLGSVLIVMGMIALAWFATHTQYTIDHLGRVGELAKQLVGGWELIWQRYITAKAAIAQHVLPPDSYSDAKVVTLLVWLGWYSYNVVITFSLGYMILFFYGWLKGVISAKPSDHIVIYAYLIINLLVTMGFLAQHLFISKRYLVALTLILLVWVPFALDHLWQQRSSIKNRIILLVSTLLVISSAIGGVYEFGYPKTYLKQAGSWIDHHIPKEAALYANDFQLMYYSNHYGNAIFERLPQYMYLTVIANGGWRKFDYLAIRLGSKPDAITKNILNELPEQPVAVFNNQRGNAVAIYRIKKQEGESA